MFLITAQKCPGGENNLKPSEVSKLGQKEELRVGGRGSFWQVHNTYHRKVALDVPTNWDQRRVAAAKTQMSVCLLLYFLRAQEKVFSLLQAIDVSIPNDGKSMCL